MKRTKRTMLADFDFLAVSILVSGDLGVGLGLGLALLLHLDPAELLGHRLHHLLALDQGVVVAVVAWVIVAGTGHISLIQIYLE